MSLKAFHIVFVTISILLALGFGAWAIRDYRANNDTMSLIMGVGSLVSAIALIWYGRWFLKKLQRLSYL